MLLRDRGGFSILEVMIAMMLLALILFSLGLLIPISQVRVRNTANHDMAFTLAENIMEKIRGLPWENIEKNRVFRGYIPDPAVTDGMGTQIYPPEPYPSLMYDFRSGDTALVTTTRSVPYVCTVKSIYDSHFGTEDLLDVTVQVNWTEPTGSGGSAEKSVSLSSRICRR